MSAINRVLDPEPVATLSEYTRVGGGTGLEAARRLDGAPIIDEIDASGLRGRGGAGFPTGVKWRTVAAESAAAPPRVVVNAAEGEPGSFKDRAILRANPYRVLEGALVAAQAVGADEVIVATKQSFRPERRRIALAIAAASDAGWLDDVGVRVVTGPGDYLFGEETALLEVVEGRQPFPRIAPPYRQGVSDPADTVTSVASGGDDARSTGTGATGPGLVLANNVETLANVPDIVARGAEWFRSLGTAESPGTIVCTVSGDTRRAGVGEFPMGTPLDEIIDTIGGGPRDEARLVAAVSGVSNAIVPAAAFDTPASYEAMASIGSGLGAAGFIVLDDGTDLTAFAHAVSRFLAVESCGQCEPCKADGLEIAAQLDAIRRSATDPDATERIGERLATITDGARCALAEQHRAVVTSVLDMSGNAVGDVVHRHVDGSLDGAAPVLVAPIVDIVDGVVTLDAAQADKQPDWSRGADDSGRWPAAHLGDIPVEVRLTGRAASEPTVPSRASHTTAGHTTAGGTPGPDAQPVPIDVASQLELAHDDLVATLLTMRSPRLDAEERRRRARRFAQLLDTHMETITQVLIPWAERTAGEEGAEIAVRAEELDRAAQNIVATIVDAPADPQLQELVDDLHSAIIDEERRLLPLLERHLDDEALDDIGRAMHEARRHGTGAPRTRPPSPTS